MGNNRQTRAQLNEALIAARKQNKILQDQLTALQDERREQVQLEQALTNLLKLSQVLVSTYNLDHFLGMAVSSAVELVNTADRGSIQLLVPNEDALETVAIGGTEDKILETIPFKPGVGIAGNVMTSGTLINVPDVLEDSRFIAGNRPLQFRSLLVAPLMFKGRFLGTLSLSSRQVSAFSPSHADLVQLIADQTAVAMENARQFEHFQSVVSKLAGGIAHDFNNILTIIMGYSNLLLHKMTVEDAGYKQIKEIDIAAAKATALTRQLLALSGKQLVQPQALNVNEAISRINKQLRHLLGQNIDLIFVLNEPLGLVKIDAEQLEQAILHLISYLRERMSQGGKLSIETIDTEIAPPQTRKQANLQPGRYVKLLISDTGPTLDEKTLSQIFEPFFAAKGLGYGTGLELAIVSNTIRRHGGFIRTISQPGAGMSFEIYLPCVEDFSATQATESAELTVPNGFETILIVEDQETVRELTGKILRHKGYTILQAKHGLQAMQISGQYQGTIDLLLTDVVMPGGISGRQLADSLLSVRPQLKVLYMSGYADNTLVKHGVLDPQYAFMPKPFTPSALACKVRQVLDNA